MSREEYEAWRYLARAYLDLQHLRIACEARLRKLREIKNAPEIVKHIMEDYYLALKEEEKAFLRQVAEQLKNHPLWEWCQNVKGMGPVACLTFLGFINPYVADTAGKAKGYLGAVPGARLQSGQKAKGNPEGKGRVWLVTRNVIMQKDDYYYPAYLKKKEYYMNTARRVWIDGMGWVIWPPFKELIADPSKCPKYKQCVERIMGKAERLKRPPKKVPCAGHCDAMAKRWLMGLLISHAAQLMREAEGLDVSNFLKHRDYIPPKGWKPSHNP